MFARIITARPKPGMVDEATKALETQIVPLLNTRKGFREAYWLSGDATEMVAISLWDSKEDAEAYMRENSAQVMDMMTRFTEGMPQVKMYDVVYSTVRKAAAGRG